MHRFSRCHTEKIKTETGENIFFIEVFLCEKYFSCESKALALKDIYVIFVKKFF
jgi:hypothetical protein